MDKTYVETPTNFEEIAAYAITDKETIVKEIITAQKLFFYDTCSFRSHMMCEKREEILAFIARLNGVVVITRLILMELLSGDSVLWKEHIAYIKQLHDMDIKVIIMYEEDVFHVLDTYYSSVKAINKKLRLAVNNVKTADSAMDRYIEEDKNLRKALWEENEKQSRTLASTFFKKMRSSKTSEDSLGEEVVAVCVHMLSNISETGDYKYTFLTDDKGAVRKFSRIIDNVERHAGHSMIACMTTPKLAYRMVKAGMIDSKEAIQGILKCCATEGHVTVMASQTYEMKPDYKTLSISDCAERMLDERALTVYW